VPGKPAKGERLLEDAEALLVLHPHIDLGRARRRVCDLAALADAPELVQSFDAMARRARGRPRASPTFASAGRNRTIDALVSGLDETHTHS
jgi:hypothetical protein